MGIKISMTKVLEESEARKAAGPPMPRVKSRQSGSAKATTIEAPPSQIHIVAGKEAILRDLYNELAQVSRDRSKLSSQTPVMIYNIRGELAREGKGILDQFNDGKLPMPELQEHYARIQRCTQAAIRLGDRIKHVERHGTIPAETPAPIGETKDESALKHRLRTLNDAIHKTRVKLKKGNAYNPSRLVMWEEKVSLLEAEREEVRNQLKQLQLNVRNEASEGQED